MRRILCSLVFFSVTCSLNAQEILGFTMPEGKKKIEIPFEEFNNLVVIPVYLNNFLKIKFVVDTGVETPILTDELFARILGLEYSRMITIKAPGIRDSVNAAIAHSVNFQLPGDVRGRNLNILVLQEDYLKLSEKMGDEVYGIIGYDLFKRFVVKINYDTKIMTLITPEKFKPRKKYIELPLELIRSKPYLSSKATNRAIEDTVRLMVDTGASHAVLIDVHQTQFPKPEKMISTLLGTGIAGDIHGDVGRLAQLSLSEKLKVDDIIMSMPDPDEYSQSIKRGSRHGTLGGDLLSRFNPIFDYSNSKIYLSRSKRFNRKFEYDMSGIDLRTRGVKLDTLFVEAVRKDSPASEAGIQSGDLILRLNGMTLEDHPLSKFYAILRKKPGLKIRVVIKRGDEILKKQFKLRRSI